MDFIAGFEKFLKLLINVFKQVLHPFVAGPHHFEILYSDGVKRTDDTSSCLIKRVELLKN